MINVLVPTDFSPASVKACDVIFRMQGSRKCNIILFHAFELPEPYDMLVSGFKDPVCDVTSDAFRRACQQLKKEYPDQLGKVIIRSMNGNTNAVFSNYAEANDIDFIFIPQDFIYHPVHKRSVNPLPFFEKSAIPRMPLQKKAEPALPQHSYLDMPVTA